MRNYEHSMRNLEHKGLIYLRPNRFWAKNRTPGSDEYQAIGISQMMGVSSQNMKSGMPLGEFKKITLSHDNNLFILIMCV